MGDFAYVAPPVVPVSRGKGKTGGRDSDEASATVTRQPSQHSQSTQNRNARRVRAPSPPRTANRRKWMPYKAVVAEPLLDVVPNLNVGSDKEQSVYVDPMDGTQVEEVRMKRRRRRRKGVNGKEGSKIVVKYNTEMKRAANMSNLEGCLSLMQRIREEGLVPDKYSYSIAMSCCAKVHAVDTAVRLYDRMKEEGVTVDDYIRTNLLTVAANSSPPRLDLCSRVFQSTLKPSLVMCNVMMDAYANAGRVSDCLSTYRYMSLRGLQADRYTVSAMIKAYVVCGRLDEAMTKIHEMHACGLEVSSVAFGLVMGAYGRAGAMEKAIAVFDAMTLYKVQPTQVTFNILIGACLHGSEPDRAFEIYDEMRATSEFMGDRYTLHSLMQCCLRKMDGETAMNLYRTIKRSTFLCNQVSYRLALTAAGQAMDLDAVLEVADDIVAHKVFPRKDTAAMLVASAIRCSDLESALKFFSEYITRQKVEAQVFSFLDGIREGLRSLEEWGKGSAVDCDHTMRVVDELERSWREGL